MSVKRYDFFVERTEIPEFSPFTSGYVTYEDYVKVRKERDELKKQRDDYQTTIAYFLAEIKTLDCGWIAANIDILSDNIHLRYKKYATEESKYNFCVRKIV